MNKNWFYLHVLLHVFIAFILFDTEIFIDFIDFLRLSPFAASVTLYNINNNKVKQKKLLLFIFTISQQCQLFGSENWTDDDEDLEWVFGFICRKF